MSKLTSPKDYIVEYVIKGKKLPEDVAEDLGLDVDMLSDISADLKPHFDYYRGYHKIADWFDEFDPTWYGTLDLPKYFARLKQLQSREYEQCILLLDGEVIGVSGTALKGVAVRVFVTRAGHWVFWTNYLSTDPDKSFVITSATPRGLMGSLSEYFSESAYVSEVVTWPRSDILRGRSRRKYSLALTLAMNLVRKFEKSYQEKVELLEPEKSKISTAYGRLAPFDVR